MCRRYFTPPGEENTNRKECDKPVAQEDEGKRTEEATTSPKTTTTLDPTIEKESTEDTASVTHAESKDEASESASADALPNLPDVPTKEPALPGEPEVKKLKLSQ